MAVIPTIRLTGRASFLTFSAPRTQAKDSVGGSGITTERAVQKSPLSITNAEVRWAAKR
jgi:hypothetical protein